MNRIIKILIILIITLSAIVIYLSIYGIKTEKFNNEIIKNVSKINKKINLSLNEVSYLLIHWILVLIFQPKTLK